MTKHRRTGRAPSIDSIGARITDEQGLRLAATSRDSKFFRKSPRIHVDDIAVDQMATAMKAKLAEKRGEGGGGWDNPLECSIERLAQLMAEAMCKGKLVNVANYAAMLRARGADEQLTAEIAMRAFLHGSREAMEVVVAMLDRGEWAEHVAATTGRSNPLAQRLEDAITDLHNEASTNRDMLDDARTELNMLRQALGVDEEPHQSLRERMLEAAQTTRNAVVYPPDGTISPFTVINLGLGQVQMGDCTHDQRLPALWFGKDGKGMGHFEVLNREAKEGETIAVVTLSNVDGLDVLLDVVQRIRRESFPDAAPSPYAAPASTGAPEASIDVALRTSKEGE